MRKRSVVSSFVTLAASAMLLAGCSGKPENSPAIRKKFAEFDQVQKSLETMTADVESMKTEVARLTQENSELRAFMPTVDGASAISKLQAIEARLSKVEGLSASAVISRNSTQASATPRTASSSNTVTASATDTTEALGLDQAPLAVLSTAGSASNPDAPAPSAVAQQSAPRAEKSSPSAAFKNMTRKAETKPTQTAKAPAPAPAATKKANTTAPVVKAAASKPSSARGGYHTIASGETISTISAKYGVSPDQILKANGIPSGVRLARGQRLYIPSAK